MLKKKNKKTKKKVVLWRQRPEFAIDKWSKRKHKNKKAHLNYIYQRIFVNFNAFMYVCFPFLY